MDNLVLVRVRAVLDHALRRGILREVQEESPRRFRLVFEAEDRRVPIVVSLRAEMPWIGRPALRRPEGARRSPGPLVALLAKSLAGSVVDRIDKLGADRVLCIRFADGRSLVVEVATHGGNLVFVDAEGRIVAAAGRSTRQRIAPGGPYEAPRLPAGRLVPFVEDAATIDGALRESLAGGEDLITALRKRLFGIEATTARLVARECAETRESPGTVLVSRLRALELGHLDPVIESEVADPRAVELLPWAPSATKPGRTIVAGADAAETAGLYYEALERALDDEARGETLRAILTAEIDRLARAESKVVSDLASFEAPERFRIWGEAILAGLTRARRSGDFVRVPDPYAEDAREIAVPAPAARSLTAVAEDHFRRHRRAHRGIEAARARLQRIRERGSLLRAIEERHPEVRGPAEGERLADAMRGAGIPVALEPGTRVARAAARAVPPRLEGVRIYESSDGFAILVGRSARDNDRLTFRLAGPEDFWLHALDATGAHVVVRNPRREPRPPRRTLEEAAAIAAWHSEARGSGEVDVQWTRRKNVRRARGGPAGMVVLKRFETVRVRPQLPPGQGVE